jgi:hypothetical protein
MGKTQKLTFDVQGDFITDMARTWYYEEGKPYEKAEELLLSCMCGTTLSTEQLKVYAKDIMVGRRKLIGSTREDTFGMVDDNDFDPSIYFERQKQLANYHKNRIESEYIPNDEEEYDEEIEDKVLARYDGHSLLGSFMKAIRDEEKYGCNYGWLEPSGYFHEVEINHLDYAKEMVEQKGWKKDFNIFFKECIRGTGVNGDLGYEGDFLVSVKGWILLNNPSRGTATPKYNIKRGMTKAQREFLFDYYSKRKEYKLAQYYLEDNDFNHKFET